jgi:PhzF family phenazine biosynthesis protein
MKQKIYQVDAFADKVFTGNPAAVCPLEEWPDDAIMQKIAMENNLAETAFYIKQEDHYLLRWFTPGAEVDLCGHATLAAAFVLFNYEGHKQDTIHFFSPRSGILSVKKEGDLLILNFPADIYHPVELTKELTDGFNFYPKQAFKGKTDYLLIFENEQQIKDIVPKFEIISQLEARGVIVSAKGDNVDFVSRFFAPQVKVNEDPVTGSAHTTLIPYWADVLKKDELSAIQLSERKGYLQCKYLSDRVEIGGEGQIYLIGEIFINQNIHQ